jgi:hypothetical protein
MNLLRDAGMIGMHRLQVSKVCKNKKWFFKILKGYYSMVSPFCGIERVQFLWIFYELDVTLSCRVIPV